MAKFWPRPGPPKAGSSQGRVQPRQSPAKAKFSQGRSAKARFIGPVVRLDMSAARVWPACHGLWLPDGSVMMQAPRSRDFVKKRKSYAREKMGVDVGDENGAAKDFKVFQMDVKSAFLYGKIDEEIYVDDTIFGSTNESLYKDFEALLKPKFEMSQMGELTFFLGLQVMKTPTGIFINQSKYVNDILERFNFTDCKALGTPMSKTTSLGPDLEGEDVDQHLYRAMIGSLMYLTTSRYDIMFATFLCARFQANPKSSHMFAVKRIFRYLKGAPILGMWYPRNADFQFMAYTNSDYGGCNISKKSTSGGSKHSKTKHIEIRYHFIRDCVEKKLIHLVKVDTEHNLADLFTIAFDEGRFWLTLAFKYVSEANAFRRTFSWKISFRKPFSRKLVFHSKSPECHSASQLSRKTFFSDIPDLKIKCDSILNVDIRRSRYNFALTVKPVVYESPHQQFWCSCSIASSPNGRTLMAIIDAHPISISVETIFRHLHLNDAGGRVSFTRDEVAVTFSSLGYEGPLPSTTYSMGREEYATAMLERYEEDFTQHPVGNVDLWERTQGGKKFGIGSSDFSFIITGTPSSSPGSTPTYAEYQRSQEKGKSEKKQQTRVKNRAMKRDAKEISRLPEKVEEISIYAKHEDEEEGEQEKKTYEKRSNGDLLGLAVDDDDFQSPPPPKSTPKTGTSKSKFVEFDSTKRLRVRNPPKSLCEFLDILTAEQKSAVDDIGFSRRLFKINFLVVFNTIMAQMSQGSTTNMSFLTSLKQGADFKSFDWCSYIITCLNITKDKWNGKEHYNGPATFLTLLYAHHMNERSHPSKKRIPAISYSTFDSLMKLETTIGCKDNKMEKQASIQPEPNKKSTKRKMREEFEEKMNFQKGSDEILEPINEWKSRFSKYNKEEQNESSTQAEGDSFEDILCSQKSEDDALDLNQDEANVEDGENNFKRWMKNTEMLEHFETNVNVAQLAIEIVDNIRGRLHAKCAANVRKVQKIVSLYLEKESPALHKKIVNLKSKKLEKPWQTEKNFVDYGIFAMRHMETYMAKEMKEWKKDCGILEESSGKQHDQLLDLRYKYLSKILLSDINILHDEVTKEVKKFEELDEEVKNQMRRNARKRIQKRKTQD
ncbi:hypothetical protein E3N88_13833 [Mikania micrantha]|uniref:Reverse transcriptase Ty1/copia-type domain-containing protein n=1 Tax=Mikania micrantha TaxID=192012 RepID=A0A5N6P1R7_9ASTR|nr:hypothetical protein E3N88_13833 [Mikania micrantha]